MQFLSRISYLGKYCVYYLRYAYAQVGIKLTWLIISTILSKTKDFPRSQPVTYNIVNVVISQKRCKMESLLLQTTNTEWHMTCRKEIIPITLNHLQLCSSWQDFNWHSASRGPFAVAKLFVYSDKKREAGSSESNELLDLPLRMHACFISSLCGNNICFAYQTVRSDH